jgi:hypothetical protein
MFKLTKRATQKSNEYYYKRFKYAENVDYEKRGRMVFEQIYKNAWIAERPGYAFLLGVVYSIFGIMIALILFPEDPSFAAITFTTIAIVPSLNKLLALEENEEASRDKITFFSLYQDHKDIFLIYVFLFLGILFAFSFFSILLPTKFIK